MSEASWPLQKALYTHLSTASALTTLLGTVRLYDAAPQNAIFPYITLHSLVARPWDTSTEEGCEHRAHFHVYDRHHGGGRVRRILGALHEVLHDGTLTVEGHHLVHMHALESDAERLKDGDTWRGRSLFRILTEPKA